MQHDHINPAFDQDIGQMDGYLVKMESSISEQLKMIRTAFAEMDVSLAQQIRRQDRRLNDLAINLERCAVGILARHQPVAEDLRHAVGVIKMSIEYERAGGLHQESGEKRCSHGGVRQPERFDYSFAPAHHR